MKVAILTMGTRGDVQPYAVLGQALQLRGHQVTLSTAKNYESLVRSYGIEFMPIEADFQELLQSEEGKKMMKVNVFAIRRNLNKWLYPLITSSLVEFYKLAKESDIVLYHVKTLADSFADQFPTKMIRASVLPIVEPTIAFPNPAFSGLPIPSFLNRLTYRFSNLSIKLLSTPIGRFRSHVGLPRKFKLPVVKNIYSMSPAFLPTPSDIKPSSAFHGFWLARSADNLSPDLLDFINAGDPPLLLTFGSMPYKNKFDIQSAILKLIAQLNIRLIVVKGWGLDHTEKIAVNDNIKVISSAPYDNLFPLVKAIIHHGGIGTTAACLQAGKPFFICPILYPVGDQMFWGAHSSKIGVAIEPIPINKMSERQFIESVKKLVTDDSLYQKAIQLKKRIDLEQGLNETVLEIETYFKANNKSVVS